MTRGLLIQILKYLINFGTSTFFALSIFVRYGLWVAAPRGQSRQESFEILNSKMINSALGHLVTIVIVLGILTFVTFLIQRQIEKRKRLRELIAIMTINFMILIFGLGLGIWTAYHGLLSEIDRNFK